MFCASRAESCDLLRMRLLLVLLLSGCPIARFRLRRSGTTCASPALE